MTDTPIAYLCLNETGAATARKLAETLPGVVHGLDGRVRAPDVPFVDVAGTLRAVFADGRPIVALCAAGIVVRALGPVLADKRGEPPVLALAADGSAVVPLLGGHNGANRLARRIGAALDVAPALTTAGEVVAGVALDDPPAGWGVSNPGAAKALMAGLVDGRAPEVVETEKTVPEGTFALHPPVLTLGLGCERDTPAADLLAHVRAVLADNGLSEKAVACVASHELKMDEPAIHAVAEALGVPATFFTAGELEAEAPRLANPSETVFAEVGCHGVAEGAALAAAGAAADLVVPKVKGARVTCAVAKAPAPVEAVSGKRRGRLFVVGIGPGQAAWRTPEVTDAVARSDALVGYGLYLDLLGGMTTGKEMFETGLGDEEGRARRALELAAEGRTVSLVCSGDAGIYALATLVFELLDREDKADWNRVAITVCPGVSALQAAAARAGAPLGHDFCAISLSDLLTPRAVIGRRVEAAAKGDFVVAFYNPVSKRRRELLATARDTLLAHRPADTPVLLARNLGRPDEALTVVPLSGLEVDDVDMLTLVLVGNSETRVTARGGRRWVFTPRGYAGKMDL